MAADLMRTALAQGVSLSVLSDPKFKHNRLSVNLIVPMDAETISANALLPCLMRKGCEGLLSISENKGGHKKASSAHRKSRSHPAPNRKTAVDQRFNRPKEFVWQAFPFSPKNPTLGRKGADGASNLFHTTP